MIKRVIALLLVFSFVLSFSACKRGEDDLIGFYGNSSVAKQIEDYNNNKANKVEEESE